MRVEHEGGARYGACPQCAGLWFGDDGLRKLMALGPPSLGLVEERNRPVRSPQLAGSLLCPDCGARMMKYRYAYASPVELDGCESCGGVFVQDGELAAIQEWTTSQSAKPDAAAALAAMVGEAAQTRAWSERIQHLSRVAMMRSMWIGWDMTDVIKPPRPDKD